ncbi:MAG: DUF86 domain-containing protein [Candidatus Methanoperedens sp.]|nr:DUF86 domain-containing protein [Candidatus Methanoperedens sp.]
MEKADRVRILSKLDEMIQYVRELQEMLPDQEEYFQDLIKRRACEKTVEVAIELLIDAAAMIVSAQRFGLPTSEENILDILVKKRILSRELGEKLKDMKGFRNVLVHRYTHVDDGIVFHNLNNYLNDFYEFKNAVESYLAEQN